jgi:hypothetical protein
VPMTTSIPKPQHTSPAPQSDAAPHSKGSLQLD